MSGMKGSSCSCKSCKALCQVPCWGTPTEMRAIMAAQGPTTLSLVKFEDEGHRYEVLIPAAGSDGGLEVDDNTPIPRGCVFQGVDGLCKVHKLKPLEGRITYGCSKARFLPHEPRAMAIAPWKRSRIGKTLVAEWRKRTKRHRTAREQIGLLVDTIFGRTA